MASVLLDLVLGVVNPVPVFEDGFSNEKKVLDIPREQEYT